uniref:SP110 nuclear antigen, tandem duplicate 4 n=1 Tax=Takifugu rubripes TaxID=31033 RepID=A0A3B5JZJ4_TAKRU
MRIIALNVNENRIRCPNVNNQAVAIIKTAVIDLTGPGSNQSLTSFHIENEVESEARDGRLKALSGSEENKETNATPAKRKRRKLKGSKWPIYKVQLPVRCGEKKGLLNRKRMAKGLKCIMVSGQWFSPTEFERFAGKQRCKNWKLTIQCMGTPLGKLIQVYSFSFLSLWDGNFHECVCTCLNEQAEQEPEGSPDVCNTVFKVACGISFGALHKKRFASGTCGKCIRTATSWMTPIEFVEASLGQTNTSWRRDIRWEGKPLAYLIKDKTLRIHFLKCNCPLCNPSDDDLRNDDECWVCKSDEDRLVLCDKCPRSFHKTCHLPYVEDADLFPRFSRPQPDESAVFTELRRMLGIIAEKLQFRFYETVGQFVSEVELIFTNSASPHQVGKLLPFRAVRVSELCSCVTG